MAQLNRDMPVPNSSIWVVVAREDNASICVSREGTSSLLREVTPPAAPEVSMFAGHAAKRAFAWEIMSELCRGAQDRSFDGVIIVAEPDMLDELRRVTLPAVRKYLIAEIVGAPERSMERGMVQ